MAEILEIFDRQPKWLIFIVGLVLVALIGYIDYLTGEFSLLVFYLIPIGLVSWNAGCWQGIVIAVLSGCTHFIADYIFCTKLSLLYWNSISDTAFLIIVAIIINALRYALEL